MWKTLKKTRDTHNFRTHLLDLTSGWFIMDNWLDCEAKGKKRRDMSDEQLLKVVDNLIEGAPGVSAPRPLPLSALTKHKALGIPWAEVTDFGQKHRFELSFFSDCRV